MPAKIPISNDASELAEMDFVDIGGHAAIPHIKDYVSRFSSIVTMERQRKKKNGSRS